jgi:hypothetical protein
MVFVIEFSIGYGNYFLFAVNDRSYKGGVGAVVGRELDG